MEARADPPPYFSTLRHRDRSCYAGARRLLAAQGGAPANAGRRRADLVAITGMPLDHHRKEARAEGFDAYLAKPFNSTYLSHVIHSALANTA